MKLIISGIPKKIKEMGVLDSTSAENILHGKIRNKSEEFKISL